MRTQAVVCSTAVLVFLAGCGGGATPPPLSQSQSITVAQDLYTAMADAIVATSTAQSLRTFEADRLRALSGAPAVAQAQSSPAAPRSISPDTALPTYTFTCPGGGTIAVTGSYTDSSTQVGTSTSVQLQESIVETPNKCIDTGITINGNPNAVLTSSLTLASNVLTDYTTFTGNLTIGSQSCSLDLALSATENLTNGANSGTVTGSVCGVQVNASL